MKIRISPEHRPNEYNLTQPQAKALRTLRWAEKTGTNCSESNDTTHPGAVNNHQEATVYWQVRAWAERQGFLTVRFRGGRGYLFLTDLGRELADAITQRDAQAAERDSRRRAAR